MNTKISLNINVFAVYVGLVAAGYDMTNSSGNEKLINGLRNVLTVYLQRTYSVLTTYLQRTYSVLTTYLQRTHNVLNHW